MKDHKNPSFISKTESGIQEKETNLISWTNMLKSFRQQKKSNPNKHIRGKKEGSIGLTRWRPPCRGA